MKRRSFPRLLCILLSAALFACSPASDDAGTTTAPDITGPIETEAPDSSSSTEALTTTPPETQSPVTTTPPVTDPPATTPPETDPPPSLPESDVTLAEGITLTKDGVIVAEAKYYVLFDIGKLSKGNYDLTAVDTIRVGKATFAVTITESNDSYSLDYNLNYQSITAFGRTIDLTQFYFGGNYPPICFETEDAFVIMGRESGVKFDAERYIVLTQDFGGLYKYYDETTDSYITFVEKDGVFTYERQPNKYYNPQAVGVIIAKTVARDELFLEKGTVTVTSEGISLHMTEQLTVEQCIDMEEEFANWKNTVSLPEELTLEEFLAQNAEQYDRAE